MDGVRYYSTPMTLKEAEQYIQGGLITAARAYVANGYYLRRIRDDKLFEEAGYQNFEEYVRGKYNKDKGWASKCIKVNQQLSEDGNSPILSKQYLEYTTYQLVELAYMTEDQREEAEPDMTVNQLKQIRKPEEAVSVEKSCDVTTFGLEEKEKDPDEIQEPEIDHFLNQNKSIDDAYGAMRSDMVVKYLRTGYKSPDKECEIESFGQIHRVLKEEHVTVFYGSSGKAIFDVENTRLEREYNFFFGNKEEPESREPEEQEEVPHPEFYNPDDEEKVDESYSMAGFPKASNRHVTMLAQLFVRENARRLFGNGELIGITDDDIISLLKLFQRRSNIDGIIIDGDVEVSVAEGIIEFYRGDEDLGICLFQKFANYVHNQINEYIKERAAKERQDETLGQQQENNQKRGTLNSTPTSCPHREEYSCTVLEENRSVPGDGSKCGSSCCWICKFQGKCKLECNASASRDGGFPEYDAAWFIKQWAKYSPGDLKRVLEACRRGSTNAERAKAVQEEISPYGAHCSCCWEYDFSFHGFAGGMDFRVGKVDIHLKYGRFVRELMNLYPDFEESESKDPDVVETQESVPEQSESALDQSETVIDGEFVEITSDLSAPIKTVLEEAKKTLKDWMSTFEGVTPEKWPPFIERQKIIVAALEAMAEEQKRLESEPEQPELPILKNNDQRAAFVDAYETWPLWIETKETGERYYRYDLPDGTSMVVKVYHARIFDYKAPGSYEDKFKEGWGEAEYYLLKEGSFFRNCRTSRPELIEKLKEIQKTK
ncbi:hypothetical protein [Lacrimispora sp.]|uniref:hypothetical protein n=1 Tax=Lacrimispora sp. TaxID=2719234 RepID=UPI002FD9C56A